MGILAGGAAAVGTPLSAEQLHFLRCAFTGALHLDMKEQTDESFARVVRSVEMALDAVLPRAAGEPPTEPIPTSEFTP